MKILHLTDYHYSDNNIAKERITKSLIKTIKEELIKIDIVLFTGDIVNDGKEYTDFLAFEESFAKPLTEALNLKKENIIFCPGNHDLDRTKIHSATEPYINTYVKTKDELDEFYTTAGDVYQDSLKPFENYDGFIKEYYKKQDNCIFKDLYSIHYRIIDYKKIAIVCLNSAWLSAIDKERSGKSDKSNLLIPPKVFTEIKEDLNINEVDKKIIIIHHPLYFLKEYNMFAIEDCIHSDFDMMFSGHVHKISTITRHSGSNGIFEHVSKASLSNSENLGCSIIELDDIEENKINVKELTYVYDDTSFHISKPIIYTIPCGEEKDQKIAFRRKLNDKIELEKDNANSLLLVKGKDCDFLSFYRPPILKYESEDSVESKKLPIVNLDEILNSNKNYVILGKDKCGKTSLLRKLQLDCLMNYSRNAIIPFFLDCKDLRSIASVEDLVRSIKSYYSINNKTTNEILSSDNFILLLDNYSPHTPISEIINDFLTKYNKIKYIVCGEYNLSMKIEMFNFGDSLYDRLYNYDLRRQEIVSYIDNRLTTNYKKNEVQEKIIRLCKQLELPLNYWTISLLLLIYDKSSDSYSNNLFSILDVCVDEIFGKKQILLSSSKISFEQLKNICARLAKYLFKEHQDTVYSASYSTVLSFIEDQLNTMPRISVNSKDILDFFIACGMLKYKNGNSFLVFRLNGFFEYFLAFQMTKDENFKSEVLNDEVRYLAFKNQLEIYSGFKRNDVDLLKTVYEKTRNKIDNIFEIYGDNVDDTLKSKAGVSREIEEFSRKISATKSLTTTEIAQIEDITNELDINAEVHLMKVIDPSEINSELIERYLLILGRVFKNLDEVDVPYEYVSEIFNYIINSYCRFGFYIIDEITELTKGEIINENTNLKDLPEFELLRLISDFSPTISQIWLSESICHSSLEKIIKSEIETFEKDISDNQFKLFLLYFLLLDIDLKYVEAYIKKIMNNIRIPVLKYAIFIKLNYYLIFKGGENKKLKDLLSKSIQEAQLNLDSKSDIGEIQRQIQKKRLMARKKIIV